MMLFADFSIPIQDLTPRLKIIIDRKEEISCIRKPFNFLRLVSSGHIYYTRIDSTTSSLACKVYTKNFVKKKLLIVLLLLLNNFKPKEIVSGGEIDKQTFSKDVIKRMAFQNAILKGLQIKI